MITQQNSQQHSVVLTQIFDSFLLFYQSSILTKKNPTKVGPAIIIRKRERETSFTHLSTHIFYTHTHFLHTHTHTYIRKRQDKTSFPQEVPLHGRVRSKIRTLNPIFEGGVEKVIGGSFPKKEVVQRCICICVLKTRRFAEM